MYKYGPEDNLFISACLNLTDDCNLACRYCFVEQKPNYMTLDTAKDAVQFLMKNYQQRNDKTQKIDITFFGGEPTLQWDNIIVPLVLYCEDIDKNLFKFSITTNGTLLNKERIAFLKEHNIFPLLSIDGNEICQNTNRPCRSGSPSFPLVVKNIPLLLEAFPETTFRATINNDTCQYLFDSYLFAEQQGFHNVFFCPNVRTKWSLNEKLVLKEQLEKIFLYRLWEYQSGYLPMRWSTVDQTFSDILRVDVYNYNQFEKPMTNTTPYRCGLGITSASIAYDGKIFACQEQDSRATSDIFYIGDIYNGIDQSKHQQLLDLYCSVEEINCENSQYCIKCPKRIICNESSCPSSTYDNFNNFNTKTEDECFFIIILFNILCSSMKILTESNNLLFKDYLDKLYSK